MKKLLSNNEAKLLSGIGQFHTNEPDPNKPDKELKLYLSVTWPEIQAMADSPRSVPKAQGQWLIPSTYSSRNFAEQEQHGQYWLLWADVDQNPGGIEELLTIVAGLIADADIEVYTSRSATVDNQKARVLIPLEEALHFSDWSLCQQILNDKLATAGIEPDRASERAAQLCYLPNRGEFYRNLNCRNGSAFNPLAAWVAEIEAKRAEIARQQAELEQAKTQARAKCEALKTDGRRDIYGAFNAAYTPMDWLTSTGYDQRGNTFRHPNSESGSYSASVKQDNNGLWRVHSLSSSDPLYTGGNGGGAHDAFSTFCVLMHGGDRDAALKDAGDNWLTIDGAPWNEAVRREFKERKADDSGGSQGDEEPPHTGTASGTGGKRKGAAEWPDPRPLPTELPPVVPFDYDLLPETLKPWAQDICERVQCAPDYVGVATMTGLGSVIGRKLGIRPQAKTDWTVTSNQWGMVIGRPGVLKSPAMEAALSPLKRLAAEAVNANHAEMADHKARSTLFKLQQESAAAEIKKKLSKGGASEAELLGLLMLDEPELPTLKRYIANDTTAAALGEMHRQNPNGLLVFRDELVSLLKSLDREDNAEARGFYLTAWNGDSPYTFDRIARGFYLTAWNGDSPYTFDRIARGFNLHIPAVCLSLLGSTQPGRIADYIRQAVRGGAGDDGLIQRFGLLVWPDNDGGWQDVDRWPDSEAKREANRVFTLLDQLKPESVGAQQDSDYNGEPDGLPYLRFDADAMGLFLEWRAGLEHKLRSGELHPAMESHLAKYRKLVPGLALILHLANNGNGPVTERATLQALAWAEYLESHAQRAYASVTKAELTTAKAIIQRLCNGNLPKCFGSRDVWRPGWAHLSDREQVADALQLLVDLDWLSVRIVETLGRKATVYEANPKGFNL